MPKKTTSWQLMIKIIFFSSASFHFLVFQWSRCNNCGILQITPFLRDLGGRRKCRLWSNVVKSRLIMIIIQFVMTSVYFSISRFYNNSIPKEGYGLEEVEFSTWAPAPASPVWFIFRWTEIFLVNYVHLVFVHIWDRNTDI